MHFEHPLMDQRMCSNISFSKSLTADQTRIELGFLQVPSEMFLQMVIGLKVPTALGTVENRNWRGNWPLSFMIDWRCFDLKENSSLDLKKKL